MTVINRGVLGNRNNGDIGLFISKPTFDADTTSDSNLRLNITSKVSQLIMMGRLSAGTSNVGLGLTRSPYVMITSEWNWAGVSGHTLGAGPFRPSPPPSGTAATCTINSNGSSMTIFAPYTLIYQVFGYAYT